jgi:hypothetical protein
MALVRKEVKRGRKPGGAGQWAEGNLNGKRSGKVLTYVLGEIISYGSDGTLLPASDVRTFTVASNVAVPVPRVTESGERLLAKDETRTMKQEQSRIGGQFRGAMEKVPSVEAGWESLQPDERTKADKESVPPKANPLEGISVLALTF